MQLAHAGEDGLAGLLVRPHAEGRIFGGRGVVSAVPIFSWSALDLGSIDMRDDGLGEPIALEDDGLSSSHSVSPVVTSFHAHARAMSPASHFVDFLALVGAHLHEAPTRSCLRVLGL